MHLRAATSTDIPQICHVDTEASLRFGSIQALSDLADGSHGPLEPQTVQEWLNKGSIYVVEDGSTLTGFVAAQPRDSVLYVAELAVLESEQGRGIGSMLLDRIINLARQEARDAGRTSARVSLTTYADVHWNGPWYRKRGFREVEPESVGSWHVEKARQDDSDLARPGFRRCCMLREEDVDPRHDSSDLRACH